jgi:hypothetical protein
MTVQKYTPLATAAGYLDPALPLPEAAELLARLGGPAPPPRTPSTVEPYRAQVEHLLAAGVEQMTIFDRLRDRGYSGNYSSVRRSPRPARQPAATGVDLRHDAQLQPPSVRRARVR